MNPYEQAHQWLAEQPDTVALLIRKAAALECCGASHAGLTPHPPRLVFDLRGTRAGSSDSAGTIRLNPVLLRENTAAFMALTLPHEVAHWIVFRWRPGASPHGVEWRQVMAWLGAPAQRCHDFDVTRARLKTGRRYAYRCACRQHTLGAVAHRRSQTGRTIYRCRVCGSVLRPLDTAITAMVCGLPQ